MRSIPWPLTILLLTLALALPGCGSNPKVVNTRVDPAVVSLADHFSTKLPGNSTSTKMLIAPAPTTLPGVSITQPPTPISVKVDGREISAPGGSSITLEMNDTKSSAESVHDRTANASGPTLRTDADKGNFDASAPKVDFGAVTNTGFDGAGSSGGTGSATGASTSVDWVGAIERAISATSAGTKWLVGLGIASMVGGMVWAVICRVIGGLIDWAMIGLIEVSGLILIATGVAFDTHPLLSVLAVLAIVGGIVGYEVYWKKKDAAKAIVAALPAIAIPNKTANSGV